MLDKQVKMVYNYTCQEKGENKKMNPILLFTIATVINIVLSTIRSLCTIKGGKMVSAITNAVCYGFYPLIVMLTAKDTVSIVTNMVITAIANFVCVYIIKLVEEKARKDRLWKVEVAVQNVYTNSLHFDLKSIPHHYIEVGSWTIFNFYCDTQADTQKVVDIAKQYGGKLSAYESKNLIQ